MLGYGGQILQKETLQIENQHKNIPFSKAHHPLVSKIVGEQSYDCEILNESCNFYEFIGVFKTGEKVLMRKGVIKGEVLAIEVDSRDSTFTNCK